MIAKDLCNQQELGTDIKVINFSGNLSQQATIIFHYWRSGRDSFRL